MTAGQAQPTLQYSGLPSGSRLIVEPMQNGVTVRFPPIPVYKAILASLFAGLMLFPMTGGIIYLIVEFLQGRHRIYASDVAPVILMSIVVVTFWPAVIATVWQSIRRRRVPTICTVNGATLTVITPDQPKLRREFPLHPRFEICVHPIGISLPGLRRTAELRVFHQGAVFKMLTGHDLRELQWVAYVLNEAIAKNCAGMLTSPSPQFLQSSGSPPQC